MAAVGAETGRRAVGRLLRLAAGGGERLVLRPRAGHHGTGRTARARAHPATSAGGRGGPGLHPRRPTSPHRGMEVPRGKRRRPLGVWLAVACLADGADGGAATSPGSPRAGQWLSGPRATRERLSLSLRTHLPQWIDGDDRGRVALPAIPGLARRPSRPPRRSPLSVGRTAATPLAGGPPECLSVVLHRPGAAQPAGGGVADLGRGTPPGTGAEPGEIGPAGTGKLAPSTAPRSPR